MRDDDDDHDGRWRRSKSRGGGKSPLSSPEVRESTVHAQLVFGDATEASLQVSDKSSQWGYFSVQVAAVRLEYSRLRVKGDNGAAVRLEDEEEDVEGEEGKQKEDEEKDGVQEEDEEKVGKEEEEEVEEEGKEEEEEVEEDEDEEVPWTAHRSPSPTVSSPIKSTTSSLQVRSMASRQLLLVPYR